MKGHGGFQCLENPFYPSVTLLVWLSALYAWLSNLCIFRELHSFVSQFKFSETTRTVAWPRSPSHKKQNTPSSFAQSLWNISRSHGCKLITQQCFKVAQDRFVFTWTGWEFGRFMIRVRAEDRGRLSLHIRSALCPTSDIKRTSSLFGFSWFLATSAVSSFSNSLTAYSFVSSWQRDFFHLGL